MADALAVYSANALIYTGKGQLTGVVISCSSATPGAVTFYDNTSAAGTKLLEVLVSAGYPFQILFGERFCPTFVTGLYIALAANMTATVLSRQV